LELKRDLQNTSKLTPFQKLMASLFIVCIIAGAVGVVLQLAYDIV